MPLGPKKMRGVRFTIREGEVASPIEPRLSHVFRERLLKLDGVGRTSAFRV